MPTSQLISWTPVDIAAAIVAEFRHSKEQTLHLNHPHPVRWSLVMSHIAKIAGKPVVPYKTWLQRLKDSGAATTRDTNPALDFLGLYTSLAVSDDSDGMREAFNFPRSDLTKALKESKTLRDLETRPLGPEDVERWMDYWKRKGFLV